jgi:hypothetical protein
MMGWNRQNALHEGLLAWLSRKLHAAADPSLVHRSVPRFSLSVSSDIMDIIDWQRAAIAAANSIQLQPMELMFGPFPHHSASMQVRRGYRGNANKPGP